MRTNSSKWTYAGLVIHQFKKKNCLTTAVTFISHFIRNIAMVIFVWGVLKTSAWHWSVVYAQRWWVQHSCVRQPPPRLCKRRSAPVVTGQPSGSWVCLAPFQGDLMVFEGLPFQSGLLFSCCCLLGDLAKTSNQGTHVLCHVCNWIWFCVVHFLPVFN